MIGPDFKSSCSIICRRVFKSLSYPWDSARVLVLSLVILHTQPSNWSTCLQLCAPFSLLNRICKLAIGGPGSLQTCLTLQVQWAILFGLDFQILSAFPWDLCACHLAPQHSLLPHALCSGAPSPTDPLSFLWIPLRPWSCSHWSEECIQSSSISYSTPSVMSPLPTFLFSCLTILSPGPALVSSPDSLTCLGMGPGQLYSLPQTPFLLSPALPENLTQLSRPSWNVTLFVKGLLFCAASLVTEKARTLESARPELKSQVFTYQVWELSNFLNGFEAPPTDL